MFERLYAAHAHALWLFAARWGVPWDERADIVQETFLRAWQSRQTPRGDGGGWLWTIARNLLADWSRRRWREGGDIEVELALHGRPDDTDDRVEVAWLLARLKPRDRAIVEALQAGYTGEQVGVMLGGLTKASVYRNYYYSLAVMRGANAGTHASRNISRGHALKGYGL